MIVLEKAKVFSICNITGGEKTMANSKKVVPEAMTALDKFKYEVASDMCVKNIFKHYLLATSFFYLCYFLF